MENIDDLIEEIGEQVIPPRAFRQRRVASEVNFENAVARGEVKSYGVKPPSYAVMSERPEHTLMIWMKAAGKSDEEVLAVTGYERQHFKVLQRQPWWIKRFNDIVESCGKDAVEQFIKGEVIPSLHTLRDIRDDETQRGSTRVAAANSILDRGLGKATVRIETKNTTNTDESTQEIEELRKKAEALSRQLATGGSFVPSRS